MPLQLDKQNLEATRAALSAVLPRGGSDDELVVFACLCWTRAGAGPDGCPVFSPEAIAEWRAKSLTSEPERTLGADRLVAAADRLARDGIAEQSHAEAWRYRLAPHLSERKEVRQLTAT